MKLIFVKDVGVPERRRERRSNFLIFPLTKEFFILKQNGGV